METIGFDGMKFFAAARGANDETRGTLARLRRDASGNTLAMIAMATIPLAGMVGSAVDIGRSYLIKSRLQQACDAGVLAARRAMSGSVLDANATAQGNRFFNINFSTDTAGSTNTSFTTAPTSDGQVTGTARARVPMTITKVFGTEFVDLAVKCDARLEISNTDVMMVLDTTGSMAGCPGSGGCSESKMASLRTAVVNFYKTINDATSENARFRIGFVAYSTTVNMRQDPFDDSETLPAAWFVDNWTYQSRVANMDRPGWNGSTSFGGYTTQTYGSRLSNGDCTAYGRNEPFTGYSPAATTDADTTNSNPRNTQAPATVFSDTQPTDRRRIYERLTGTWTTGGTRTCDRRWRIATTTYAENGRFSFSTWDYRPVTYNVAAFRSGTPVNVYTASTPPTGSTTVQGSYNMVDLLSAPGLSITGTSTVWEGCIEERSGNAQATFSPIPSTSWDLNINTAPDGSPATEWRPLWPELVYARSGESNEIDVTTNRSPVASATACPSASSHLAVRTESDVQSYVDGLNPEGGTYHDFGMAWGARMLSPVGMWISRNSTAPNGRPVSRHLIFMTDGIMEPQPTLYGAQGYENMDRRVMGAGSGALTGGAGGNMAVRHNARFLALCNSARASNMTIWTVNFSSSAQPTLVSCADPGKAFDATNGAQLQTQFQAIASQIAELRLAK